MVKKLGDILNPEGSKKRKFSSKVSGDPFDFLDLVKNWSDIIGPKLSEHTIPLKLVANNLTVLSNHSAFSQQLSLMENVIVQKIISKYPQLTQKIERIYFQTNPSAFARQVSEGSQKTIVSKKTPKPKIHPLSPEYKHKMAEASHLLKDVEDPELRKQLESIYLQMQSTGNSDDT